MILSIAIFYNNNCNIYVIYSLNSLTFTYMTPIMRIANETSYVSGKEASYVFCNSFINNNPNIAVLMH